MRGPLVLVGLMGSGKTSVGAALARHLGWPHRDLDLELERRWRSTVAEQFERVGEKEFRRRESALLAQLLKEKACVLSTGGGVVLLPANQALLRRHWTVYLQASPEVLAGRLTGVQARKRPLLKGQSPLSALRRLGRQRSEAYKKVATFVVRASDGDPAQVAQRIGNRYAQLG